MKVLINADDFGASAAVNAATLAAIEGGWVTSTTLLAGAPAIAQAAEMSQTLDNVSTGVHLALDDGFNVGTAPSAIIVGGEFHRDVHKMLKLCKLSIVGAIVDEFSRQIETLLKLGVKISHIDTHHHLHLYLPALLGLIKVARTYNITKVRSLALPAQPFAKRAYRQTHSFVMRCCNLASPDFYCDFAEFSALSSELKRGRTIEIMCHPGSDYRDEDFFNAEFYAAHIGSAEGSLINYNAL